jgi:glycosyltransferase involved in cell wall biosynthesis
MSTGEWRPTGMPAVFKLIEGLAADGIETDVLLLAKRKNVSMPVEQPVTFESLNGVRFFVRPYRGESAGMLGRLVNGIWQFADTLRMFVGGKYDLIYCDKAHVAYGAIFAHARKTVVLRLHGVSGFSREIPRFVKGVIPSSAHWSYRAPFAYAICSVDGTPGDRFMTRQLSSGVPRESLLNGVDRGPAEAEGFSVRERHGIADGVRLILLTGRLELDKGVGLALKAFASVGMRTREFAVLIVGEGSDRSKLEALVQSLGIDEFVTFTGPVPHEDISSYLRQSDIYVSLNTYGNSSNAVLEAIAEGKCIVTLDHDPVTGRDEQFALDPDLRNAMITLPEERLEAELPVILHSLITDPGKIRRREELVKNWNVDRIQSWDERVSYEVSLLRRLVDPSDPR